MPKIEITRTELVWPGKYDEDGNLVLRGNKNHATREQWKQTGAGRQAAPGRRAERLGKSE